MSSNYQQNLNKHITTLTSQLLTTYINMPQSHPQHHSYVNYIKKYLNDKSMLFIPRQKDVEKELDALCEKLIINSQLEKSQLLYNYVNRLKTIYESKPVIIKENLFSFIHLVLSLAHNPLKTVVNIDIMKEEFETRYIMNKIGMYIKNKNYIPDELKEIQCDKEDNNIYEFEEVDYNEKTPTWSEDEDEHVSEVNIVNNDNDNNEIQNDICNEDKQQICEDDGNVIMYVTQQQLPDKDKLQLMFTHFYKLFLNKPYFSNMSFSFFTHLLNLNSRIHPIITHSTNLTLHVDNDFLLLQLLHNLTTTPSTITSSPSLTLPFTNLIPIDLPLPLLSSLLTTFNTTYHNLSFLHHISSIFTSHNIHTSTTSKLCSIIFDFLTYHNTCLDAFAKLLHYQKGKIENSHSTFIKHIITTFPTTKYTYINTMLSHTETCINTLYTSKSKLSLFIFINFYTEHIQHIVNYFTLICKSIIQTKENNVSTSNNNAVLVKRLLDGMYRMAWGANEEMHIEVFVMLCEEYAKFVYEFIVNGNLLDVWNECFFEHAKVKHEKKKIVFCFDEKFKIFNWVDSFKIKSYVNENGNDSACVPIAFMLGNIHFKILETAKTMFLMKNLNVANYFDDMNKEVLMCKEEEEEDERNDKVNDEPNKGRNDEDVLEDLRMLNERIRIRKEEINEKGKELNMLEFALNNEVKKLNINNIGCNNENIVVNSSSSNNNCDVFEFQQSNKYVNNNDIDMYNNNYTDDDNEQSTTCISGCNNINDNSVNFIQRISCFNTTNLNSSNEIELKEISSLINLHHHPNHHSFTLSSSSPLPLHNYNINLILHKLILNRITTINTLINQKFLSILTTTLHIQHHFNLIFHIFLFKAGFSMNKFILHLNNFILSPNSHDKNFYLKTLLNTLSTSPQSDLSPFKSQILQHITIHFNSSISSYTYHSDDDLLTLSYTPPSPINIFFDDQVIKHYNIIFNLLIKMKRSFILIRDINLDKKIKELFILGNNNECTYMKVIKVLIEYRMFMLDFAYEFEFFVFHFVIDVFVNRFNNMVSKFDSIDKFINMHYRFIRDLIMYLGINDSKYMKKVYKVMNMIVVFPSLVNRLMCINRDNHEEMQYFLMEVDNNMEKFIRKKNKLINLINIFKDKLNNI